MKVRNGWVSNSSSSSFVCNVCGGIESGWDLCLSDAEMFECVNGHTFHDGCTSIKNIESEENMKAFLIERINKDLKSDNKWDIESRDDNKALLNRIENDKEEDLIYDLARHDYEFRYYTPEFLCPICTMEKFDGDDVTAYLFKKHNVDKEQLKTEIKDRFATYKSFKEFLAKE